MKLYQVEHDNCEPYEDGFSYREDEVYTDKDNLIKRIKAEGYEEETDVNEGEDFYYYKEIPGEYEVKEDMITIHEIEVINNEED